MITRKQYPNHHVLRLPSAAVLLPSRPARSQSWPTPSASAATATPSCSRPSRCSPDPKPGIDYFPLTIEVEERMYAVGRIPGCFNRREGKPSDRGVLISRLIDRPMRPLFDEELRNDVVLTNTFSRRTMITLLRSSPPSALLSSSRIPTFPGTARLRRRMSAIWTASISSTPRRSERNAASAS